MNEYWPRCELMRVHVAWHSALYYIETGEYEHAASVFDHEIAPKKEVRALLGLG